MNRTHTVKQYLDIVEKLKLSRPDIALSSDFIVGFPGETDKDFEETMKFVEEVKFVIAYSFMFSPRPGTPAFKLKAIDKKIKKARLSALQSLLKQQQAEFNKSFINKEMEILFEKKGIFPDNLQKNFLSLLYVLLVVIKVKYLDKCFIKGVFPDPSMPSKTIIGLLDITPNKEIY